MRAKGTLSACLLLAALAAGCASMSEGNDPTAAAAPLPTLDGTTWVLARLPGHVLADGHPVTLHFESGQAQGTDGCNRYGNSYSTQGSAISISAQGMSTQMACPPELMQQAAAYKDALAGARTWRVADGQLQLLGGDGVPVATFAPQSQALPGTTWRAVGINNGKGGVVSVAHGSTVTLEFTADGEAHGSAGCNSFRARYEASGSALRIGPAATTRKFCAGEGLMEQEAAFLRALETVATARFEGNRLELRTADGALAAAFVHGHD